MLNRSAEEDAAAAPVEEKIGGWDVLKPFGRVGDEDVVGGDVEYRHTMVAIETVAHHGQKYRVAGDCGQRIIHPERTEQSERLVMIAHREIEGPGRCADGGAGARGDRQCAFVGVKAQPAQSGGRCGRAAGERLRLATNAVGIKCGVKGRQLALHCCGGDERKYCQRRDIQRHNDAGQQSDGRARQLGQRGRQAERDSEDQQHEPHPSGCGRIQLRPAIHQVGKSTGQHESDNQEGDYQCRGARKGAAARGDMPQEHPHGRDGEHPDCLKPLFHRPLV